MKNANFPNAEQPTDARVEICFAVVIVVETWSSPERHSAVVNGYFTVLVSRLHLPYVLEMSSYRKRQAHKKLE